MRPVSEPTIDAQTPEPDADFHYTAQVEVKPTIELPALSGLPPSRPSADPHEADAPA